MADNNQRTNTSTQIRSLYSDGMSCLNISFYNTNLALRFYPCMGQTNLGKYNYDTKHGQNTTVSFEGAFSLYQFSKDIIDGKCDLPSTLVIPCANASITMERKFASNSSNMETFISINKNGQAISFKFQTATIQVMENNQPVTKIIESGLGAFMKTIEGYLTGINAERHLNKLTEDYAKLQQQQGGNKDSSNFHQSGYNNQNRYGGQKPYNNGYKKQYDQNNGQQQWNNNGTQNMSSYNIPN